MIRATRIRMHDGKEESNSVLEIKEIYLTGDGKEGFYPKEKVHDMLVDYPYRPIEVNIRPYPKLIAATKGNQKYVRSESNDSIHDNLLRLPKK